MARRSGGLRGGQPSYFMYQPGEGINVAALGELMLQGGTPAAGATGAAGAEASDVEGTLGQRRAYDAESASIAYDERQLKLKAINSGEFTSNNPDLGESDSMRDYVYGMKRINARKAVQSQNRMVMKTNLESADAMLKDARDSKTLGNVYLEAVNGPNDYLGTGYAPVPSLEGDSYFTVEEGMAFARRNIGFTDGYADPMSTPGQYDAGDLSKKTTAFLESVSDNMSETPLMFRDGSGGKVPYALSRLGGLDKNFIVSGTEGSNTEQLAAAIENARSTLSSSDKAELTAEWASAKARGERTVIAISAAEKAKWKKKGINKDFKVVEVGTIDPYSYYFAKVSGLAKAYQRTKVTSKITGVSKDAKDKPLEEEFDTGKLNINELIQSPLVISTLGTMVPSNFIIKEPSSDIENKEAVEGYELLPTWEYEIPLSYVDNQNKNIYRSGNLPNSVSAMRSMDSVGMETGILSTGQQIDFRKYPASRFYAYGNKVVLGPQFGTNIDGTPNSNVEYTTDQAGNPTYTRVEMPHIDKDEDGKPTSEMRLKALQNAKLNVYQEVWVVLKESEVKNLPLVTRNDPKKPKDGDPEWIYRKYKQVDGQFNWSMHMVDKNLSNVNPVFGVGGFMGMFDDQHILTKVLVRATPSDVFEEGAANKKNKELLYNLKKFGGGFADYETVQREINDSKHRAIVENANK